MSATPYYQSHRGVWHAARKVHVSGNGVAFVTGRCKAKTVEPPAWSDVPPTVNRCGRCFEVPR